MTTTYVIPLLHALSTINLAIHYHHHKDKNGVVRKTARRLLHKQTDTGAEYLRALIQTPQPYAAFKDLEKRLEPLL